MSLAFSKSKVHSVRMPPRVSARRSPCPVACTLDLLGDRWTLLVIRDLFHGRRRYGEFAAAPEGIPTNLLADRLARLEAAGIVARRPYQRHPPRHEYRLTPKGRALRPLLRAMAAWGKAHLAGTRTRAELRAGGIRS